ncbi:MAG: RNA polymerase sigma factor [Planctomycetota bacterium]
MDKRITDLCKRVRKADKDAACELLKICYPDVFAYLRRLCGSNQDAEDLTQQTFLKVWSSLGGFAGRSKFSTWLYRIAHNTYVDWRRGTTTGARSCADQWWHECEDGNPGPLAHAADRQLAQRLYEAVDQLDEDKRHVVHLHYYQGLSIRQTAKVLNVAASTVKYRLREVLRILQAKIDVEKEELNLRETIPLTKGDSL